MVLCLQFAMPFDAQLPQSSVLVPRRAHLDSERERQAHPEILQRPIFATDRQPMMETMEGYTLLGTGIAGALSTAIVQGPDSRVQRLRPGDQLAGWQVVSITQNYLFFRRSKERRMLKLDMTRRYSASKAAPAQVGGR
jgi:hypothetical protein